MLTGYGYAVPKSMPEHGIYLPEMDAATFEDWQRQADPAKADGRRAVLPRPSHERKHRLH